MMGRKYRLLILIAVCVGMLTACGGNDSSSASPAASAQSKQLNRSDKAQASDYQNVLEQLYVAYYGRPADPAGLAYWEGVLLADNAPTNIAALNTAYSANAAVKAVVDSFGNSAESKALYGTGNGAVFINAIYQNVLGRSTAMDPAGGAYWAGLLANGTMTQGEAALAILSAAASEATTSTDEQIVANRLAVANYFTGQLITPAQLSAYSGLTANSAVRTMLGTVTATTDTTTYETTANSTIASLIPGFITTVAGNGTAGYSGDSGQATSAELHSPAKLAVDVGGNIFIADTYNHRIRKVATSGIITTVAGNGTAGYSGDNGPATSAMLNYPRGVAVDTVGNIYISDTVNNRIRKVAANGTITTLAGSGSGGSSGDNGPATSASFDYPYGLAVDASGNIFFSNADGRIREVAANGIITTVAGGGYGALGDNGPAINATLTGPEGVALDANGNIYIADWGAQRVRKVATNGIITTVAGTGAQGHSGDNGLATSAMLFGPAGVAIDANGNIYIADVQYGLIRKVSAANGIITTVAGSYGMGGQYFGDNGAATSASLYAPNGVAVDASGNIFIADTGNNAIRRVRP